MKVFSLHEDSKLVFLASGPGPTPGTGSGVQASVTIKPRIKRAIIKPRHVSNTIRVRK